MVAFNHYIYNEKSSFHLNSSNLSFQFLLGWSFWHGINQKHSPILVESIKIQISIITWYMVWFPCVILFLNVISTIAMFKLTFNKITLIFPKNIKTTTRNRFENHNEFLSVILLLKNYRNWLTYKRIIMFEFFYYLLFRCWSNFSSAFWPFVFSKFVSLPILIWYFFDEPNEVHMFLETRGVNCMVGLM